MADPRFYPAPQHVALSELIALTGAELRGGNADLVMKDVAPLQTATAQDLSFFDNKKYLDSFTASKAGACFVSPEMADKAPKEMALLVTKNPHKAYALAAQKFYPEAALDKKSIASGAFVHETAKVGENCAIEHGVYIGKNVIIGANCRIQANSVIGDGVTIGDNTNVGTNCSLGFCQIGSNVRILPGVRIGQEGFGFAVDPAGHVAVPQLGRVLIGNNVLIGANTTIDRGAGPDTVVGDGCMIDNLVQIAHNVKIGKHVIIAAQAGIAGSTEIEDYVVLAGQVGIAGHLRIGRGARIAAQSGIIQNMDPGAEVMGTPAVPLREFLRQSMTLSQLVKKQKNGGE
jgi:UDP-3-O-[3-hydroxymyristoyl] glucosamine N-acyltransferase